MDQSEWITYIAVFGFFFLFLKYLLHVASQDFNKEYPVMKEDMFLKEYGYSWDYVFVFTVYDEDDKEDMTQIQRDFTFKAVIDRVENAGLETKCFYSVQRDEIYVKVRATPERLKEEASRINYKLMLDKNRLRVRAQAGKNGVWNPITIVDEYKQSHLTPFEYIYGVFINKTELQTLYTQYDIGEKKYPFKQVDRIKLIISILQNKITDDPPGAGLNIAEMAAKSVTCGQFPIANYEDIVSLQRKWLVLWSAPWNQPLEEIRDYFGERIGFYFLYLQHYVTFLIPMAFLGIGNIIFSELLSIYGNYGNSDTIVFIFDIVLAAAMLVWSTLFVEYWKRLQSIKGMEWGMTGFEDSEQDRPLFIGIETVSPIDGSHTRYFPSSTKQFRRDVVNLIITINILGVLVVFSGIIYFQIWAGYEENRGYFTWIDGTYLGDQLSSIVSAVVIAVLNFLYSQRALALNEWQNHRTDTEFEDQLVNKIFMFQMVNSYFVISYTSFFKTTIAGECVGGDCLKEVRGLMSTIFITALVARMVQQVLVAMFLQRAKEAEESSGIEPGAVLSPLEKQYTKSPYDPMLVTLGDYAALVIQFGYTNLFVVAFPLAPTLAFLSGYIQIRTDGWKFCQAYQRPEPRPAEDIGVWQNMIEILSYLAVFYNFGMLIFTSGLLTGEGTEEELEGPFTTSYKWVIFLICQNVTIAIKFLISEMVEDVPEEVAMQLERQEFLVNKVIYDMKDEEEEEGDTYRRGLGANISIHATDHDWNLPDEDMPLMTAEEGKDAEEVDLDMSDHSDH